MFSVVDNKNPNVAQLFGQFGEVTTLPTAAITAEAVKNADIVVVRSETRINSALLEGSKIKFVGTATIGIDHVDMEYLAKNNIGFASAPGSNSNSVAEYIVSTLLVLSKRYDLLPHEMTLGVVGVGNVGSKVAKYAKTMGIQVLLNDPPLARQTGDAKYIPLDDLMHADIITLHVPLTRTGPDATYHLFDTARIGKMKTGSILINTSRGSVVDGKALLNALCNKHLRTAALDVWEHEPDIDRDLLANVALGTAHIAGYSVDGKINAVEMIHQAACKFFSQESKTNLAVLRESIQSQKIIVPNANTNDLEVLSAVVHQIYDIRQDDQRLRKLLDGTISNVGTFFRKLRSTYPERWEFHHHIVELPPAKAHLSSVLQTLGFRVTIV
jgi:erythronate-4-phosphate dehydrogenase